MLSERLNYGLAFSNTGDWQIIDTLHLPGIRDDFSITLAEPFTYFVAPHQFIDHHLNINHLSNDDYKLTRASLSKSHPHKIKDLILLYHNVDLSPPKPTWADDLSFHPTRRNNNYP
jgi:hypothetical protein